MNLPSHPQEWSNRLAALQAELDDPDRPDALKLGTYVALGQLYYDAGNYKSSLSQYQGALQLNHGSIEALAGQADCLRHLERHAEAIVFYNLALSRSPQRGELWMNRGRSYEHLGDLPHALSDYEQALHIAPHHYQLWQRHADLLYRQKRFGGALISYAAALSEQPLQEEEITSQCLFIASPGPYIQRYREQFAQLDQHLAQACEQQSNWGALWKTQGERLAKLGFWLEAIASYDQALTKHPRNPDLHLLRAQSLEAVTRWHEAEAAYQQSLALFLAKNDLEGEIRCRDAMGQFKQNTAMHRNAQQAATATQDWRVAIKNQAKKLLELLQS